MNCQQFSAVLDAHNPHHDAASNEAEALRAHASGCPDCAAAFAAHQALQHDDVPPAPKSLEAHVMTALNRGERQASGHSPRTAGSPAASASAQRIRRRALPLTWRGAAVGALALGGAAFAGLGAWTWHSGDRTGPDAGADAPASAAGARSASDAAGPESSVIEDVAAAENAAAQDFTARLMSSAGLPDGDYFPLLRVAPVYPEDAAARELEGHAVAEFTVTAEGDVADPRILESSDPAFDQSTLDAVRQFKYKPRVTGGRATAVDGARVRFQFALEQPRESDEASGTDNAPDGSRAADAGESPQPGPDEDAGRADESERSWPAFRALLAPALACLEPADIRCIELTLDEIRASHTLSPREEAEIARIYGFVHYRQGNYERAIESYRQAADAAAQRSPGSPPALMIVARLHYERRQYQQALDAAIEYLKATPQPSLTDYVFVDRLRQLGAVVR